MRRRRAACVQWYLIHPYPDPPKKHPATDRRHQRQTLVTSKLQVASKNCCKKTYFKAALMIKASHSRCATTVEEGKLTTCFLFQLSVFFEPCGAKAGTHPTVPRTWSTHTQCMATAKAGATGQKRRCRGRRIRCLVASDAWCPSKGSWDDRKPGSECGGPGKGDSYCCNYL